MSAAQGSSRATHARPNLPALTGLRFVAALGVVLFHRGQDFVAAYGPVWLRPIAASGYVGVSLFFVLSGFILAYTYYDRHAPPPNPRAFYQARVARLYPVYLVGLLIALPFGLRDLARLATTAEHVRGSLAWLAEGLLLQAWHPQTACGLNCPGWSLSVEVFFYALFPFLGFLFLRSVRAQLVLLPALWAAGLLAPALVHVAHPATAPPIDAATHSFLVSLVKYNPLLHLPEFMLGIVVAGLPGAWRERAGAWAWPVWPMGLVLATLCVGPRLPHLVLHNGLLAPVFGWLIWTLAACGSATVRALSWRPLVLLGEASYSLYIVHMPLWMWYSSAGRRLLGGEQPAIDFPLYLTLSVAVSLLLYETVELPARRAVRAFFARRAS